MLRTLVLGTVLLGACSDGGGGATPDGSEPGGDAGADASSDAGQGSGDDELTSLPPDTGGTHTPKPLGTTSAAYGYYVYLPGGYAESTASYPLLVFLHGQGQRGDGTTTLNKVLATGIPKLIQDGDWAPTHPMIVVSPQYPTNGPGNVNNWGGGDPSRLKGFIEHVMATYRVNAKRIYLTGLSHGGNGVFDYLAQESDTTSHLAAAAPIACWGPNKYSNARNTPIWVFVGGADGQNTPTSTAFVNGYNAQLPAPTHRARLTIYPGAGHDVWTRTYGLSGLGMGDPAYDLYDMNLFDWMLQYKRAD